MLTDETVSVAAAVLGDVEMENVCLYCFYRWNMTSASGLVPGVLHPVCTPIIYVTVRQQYIREGENFTE